MSTWRPAILTEILRGFLHSLQENAEIVPYIRSRQLPSRSFPIHYSFDDVQYELLTACINRK
jgi:hypothetical protein